MYEMVEGLDARFCELLREVEHQIAWDLGPFSLEYLQAWRDKYYSAHIVCKKFLLRKFCRRCFIVRLRALKMDHYAYSLDYDSGIEM